MVERKSLEKWKTPLRVRKAIDDALYAGQIKKKKKFDSPPSTHSVLRGESLPWSYCILIAKRVPRHPNTKNRPVTKGNLGEGPA